LLFLDYIANMFIEGGRQIGQRLTPTYDYVGGEIDLAEFDRQSTELDRQYMHIPKPSRLALIGSRVIKVIRKI
jgi:hypothetical protein